jgi:predicted ferric reductase
MAALLALIVLIVSSVWRTRLRLSYEAWHVLHTALALVLVLGALLHVFFGRRTGRPRPPSAGWPAPRAPTARP